MESLEEAFPVVYHELRHLAAVHLRREAAGHTLAPTELVHETYLRLVDQHSVDWNDRIQLFSVASRMMRRILVNHALAKQTLKRGGDRVLITLRPEHEEAPAPDVDLLALDEALHALAALDARQSTIVELRYFGGLSIEETATLLGISPATVKREWSTARLWLRHAMLSS